MVRKWRFRADDWLKLFEGDGRLVAVEQTQAGKMLTIFTLHTNLDQVTLKQHSVVLADKPEIFAPIAIVNHMCYNYYVHDANTVSVVHGNL